MTKSVIELAEELVRDLNDGKIQSGDGGDLTLGPSYGKGQIIEAFNEFLESEADDFIDEITSLPPPIDWPIGWPVGWNEERLKSFMDGSAEPTAEELQEWAACCEIEPDWLIFANLRDENGLRGIALIIEHYNDEPPFYLIETFPDQMAADAYHAKHWE